MLVFLPTCRLVSKRNGTTWARRGSDTLWRTTMMKVNWSLGVDKQQQDAALRLMVRAGQLKR